MVSSFMPLPRAATNTLCSTELLLAALVHAISCTATTLWSSSHTSSPLTSIASYVTIPSCVSASSSGLLWDDDSNAHDSEKHLFSHSSNPLGYISRPVSAILFSIVTAPASTTPPLQVFTSPLPAVLDVPFPVVKALFPEALLPGGRDTARRFDVARHT